MVRMLVRMQKTHVAIVSLTRAKMLKGGRMMVALGVIGTRNTRPWGGKKVTCIRSVLFCLVSFRIAHSYTCFFQVQSGHGIQEKTA